MQDRISYKTSIKMLWECCWDRAKSFRLHRITFFFLWVTFLWPTTKSNIEIKTVNWQNLYEGSSYTYNNVLWNYPKIPKNLTCVNLCERSFLVSLWRRLQLWLEQLFCKFFGFFFKNWIFWIYSNIHCIDQNIFVKLFEI